MSEEEPSSRRSGRAVRKKKLPDYVSWLSCFLCTMYFCVSITLLNSLWPSDAIWRHRSWSTLTQVMACCLVTPSHYLNQCWLIVSADQWRLSKGNFTRDIPAINHENRLQFAWIKFLSNLPGTNELKIHSVNSCGAEAEIFSAMAADPLTVGVARKWFRG